MSWNGYLMSKPISLGDVSQAVSNSSLDLGTLIANGTIQKWALHKPVRLLSGYDTSDELYTSDAAWITHMQQHVSSSDGSVLAPYGLKVTTSTNLYKISGETADAAVDWVYQQPPLNGTFWRRLLDYDGYTSTPNVPMYRPTEFTFYGYQGATNTLTIQTNDGEAGSTSIEVSKLTQLNNYLLAVIVKVSSSLAYVAIMDTSIPNSVVNGEISFTLPTNLTISSGTYDGYIVGVNSSNNFTTNTWFSQNVSSLSNWYEMIPLPFPKKSDCKFTFKYATTSPSNTVTLTYGMYLAQDYTIKRIVFEGTKPGSVVNNYKISIANVVIRDDNDIVKGTISNDVFVLSDWTTSGGVSSQSVEKNVASYNIKAGDYPNIDDSSLQITQAGATYTLNIYGPSFITIE